MLQNWNTQCGLFELYSLWDESKKDFAETAFTRSSKWVYCCFHPRIETLEHESFLPSTPMLSFQINFQMNQLLNLAANSSPNLAFILVILRFAVNLKRRHGDPIRLQNSWVQMSNELKLLLPSHAMFAFPETMSFNPPLFFCLFLPPFFHLSIMEACEHPRLRAGFTFTTPIAHNKLWGELLSVVI